MNKTLFKTILFFKVLINYFIYLIQIIYNNINSYNINYTLFLIVIIKSYNLYWFTINLFKNIKKSLNVYFFLKIIYDLLENIETSKNLFLQDKIKFIIKNKLWTLMLINIWIYVTHGILFPNITSDSNGFYDLKDMYEFIYLDWDLSTRISGIFLSVFLFIYALMPWLAVFAHFIDVISNFYWNFHKNIDNYISRILIYFYYKLHVFFIFNTIYSELQLYYNPFVEKDDIPPMKYDPYHEDTIKRFSHLIYLFFLFFLFLASTKPLVFLIFYQFYNISKAVYLISNWLQLLSLGLFPVVLIPFNHSMALAILLKASIDDTIFLSIIAYTVVFFWHWLFIKKYLKPIGLLCGDEDWLEYQWCHLLFNIWFVVSSILLGFTMYYYFYIYGMNMIKFQRFMLLNMPEWAYIIAEWFG